ncbi:hypothetical protein Ami103574_10850 [Aminipila butyrica]|uniref:Uncharacterized protein n=1 Tax=Aminipila butyrica TaxID=433296 RepID=A0A858BW17_9FIRM|nr:hypothetical protein [Aminipila butyrica]QIB69787.1 hypothetical protein Ami103574_10850 [Aminipila butyrica]
MKKSKIIILAVLLVIVGGTTTVFAASADAFAAGESFLGDTKSFIVKISTLVAIIGMGFGAIKIKTAGGNPQKIEMGFTAIKWSIFGWALVNGAPLIFATINKYIS